MWSITVTFHELFVVFQLSLIQITWNWLQYRTQEMDKHGTVAISF